MVDGGLVLVVVVSSVAVLVLVTVARSTAVDVVSAIAGTVVTEMSVVVGRGNPRKQLHAWLATALARVARADGVGGFAPRACSSLRFITAGAT